jgi:exodeoxyribonuclease VII small subunit
VSAGPAPERGAGRSDDALDTIGYADALNELESILAELEREAVDVDHLVERVQRAATLIRLCRGRIASARVEIEAVVADLERAADDDADQGA